MLNKIKGNLIDLAIEGEFDVIVHGCNCQNTMGSGLAREVKRRLPEAYMADRLYYHNTKITPGMYSSAQIKGPDDCDFIIVNAYTQDHYLPRDVDHFEYEAFEKILGHLYSEYGPVNYGFPYIGMGLAGGDKNRILAILEAFALEVTYAGGTVTLVEFDG